MTSEYPKPLPVINEDNARYWEACRDHQLVFQKCVRCGKFRNPVSIICPHCHSMEYSWERVSGRGKVFSFVVFHQVYHPAFAKDVPYNVAVIELEEGIRLLSNVVEIDNNEIRCEMPVEVVFEKVSEEITLPKFRPV